MIDTPSLRAILKDIYGIGNRYLAPISTNWFVPTIDPKEKVGTWIGYRITKSEPYIRAYINDRTNVVPFRVTFRLSFVGPQSEAMALDTLVWHTRSDVVQAFEKYQAQLNYTDRDIFSYPLRLEGYNDQLAWVTDITAQTFYESQTNWRPWREYFHGKEK